MNLTMPDDVQERLRLHAIILSARRGLLYPKARIVREATDKGIPTLGALKWKLRKLEKELGEEKIAEATRKVDGPNA